MHCIGVSGLVVEYIVAIDVTRVRFPADALYFFVFSGEKRIVFYVLRRKYFYSLSFVGLVVMTSALHAEGPRFKPGTK